MASHGESMPSVLDNKDAIIVEEALADELQGDEGLRHYKKGMWTVSELLVLQGVRREDFDRQAKGSSREKHRYSVSWALLPAIRPLSSESHVVSFRFSVLI